MDACRSGFCPGRGPSRRTTRDETVTPRTSPVPRPRPSTPLHSCSLALTTSLVSHPYSCSPTLTTSLVSHPHSCSPTLTTSLVPRLNHAFRPATPPSARVSSADCSGPTRAHLLRALFDGRPATAAVPSVVERGANLRDRGVTRPTRVLGSSDVHRFAGRTPEQPRTRLSGRFRCSFTAGRTPLCGRGVRFPGPPSESIDPLLDPVEHVLPGPPEVYITQLTSLRVRF